MKNCLVVLVVALSVTTTLAETAAPAAAESAANAAAQTAATKGETTAAMNVAGSAVAATNAAENATNAAPQNAAAEAQVDVYAIADPQEALEALRRKWPGGAERVTQSVMPNYTGRFRQLDLAQSWCAVDLAGRAKIFEDVALEGIRLKIEPPAWYYNLACALAQQGKKEEAFAALEQAVASGYNNAPYTRKHKVLTSLHDDPRFAKLMAMCDEIKRS